MNSEQFYANYVQPLPEAFLNVISFHYPFTKAQLLKFYPMLRWRFNGVLENSKINWDVDLYERLSHLFSGSETCNREKVKNSYYRYMSFKKAKSLTTTFLKNDNYQLRQIQKIEKSGILNFDKMDENFLDTYYEILRKDDWIKISKNYSRPIDYAFLKKYRSKLDMIEMMIYNKNVCWSDPDVFSMFANSGNHLLACSANLWNTFLKELVTEKLIEDVIRLIKKEKKRFKILWSLPEKNKYLIEIFIQNSNFYQLIDRGYCYFQEPIESKKTFDLPEKWEIFAFNNKSPLDGKNTRILVFREYANPNSRGHVRNILA